MSKFEAITLHFDDAAENKAIDFLWSPAHPDIVRVGIDEHTAVFLNATQLRQLEGFLSQVRTAMATAPYGEHKS
jgi:hypothetical protein